MKKLTNLLLLLLVTIWGGVNVDAQTFEVSDAPTNGKWATNTTWYSISFKNQQQDSEYRYWSLNDGDLYEGALKPGVETSDLTFNEKSLWCVVKSSEADNAYKIYNYSAGTTKVLGMTGSDVAGRAKMYDASNVPDGVKTVFYWAQSNFSGYGKDANSFRVDANGNNYVNCRNVTNGIDVIAFWDSGDAINVAGSAFIFTSYSDLRTDVSTLYKELSNTFSQTIGQIFSYSQSTLDDLKNAIPESDNFSSVESNIADWQNMRKARFDLLHSTRVIMPEAGHRYALKNSLHSDRYLNMPITYGTQLYGTTELTRNACWILEKNSDGSYNLRNAATTYYITGNPGMNGWGGNPYNIETSGFGYKLYPNTNNKYPATAAIGNDGNDYYFMHLGQNNDYKIVGWTKNAEASCWKLEEITDEEYNNLPAIDKTTADYIGLRANLIGSKLPKNAFATAKTTFEGSKTLENAQAFQSAVEDSRLVRFLNVKTMHAVEPEGNQVRVSNTTSPKDVPSVWYLDFVDEANADFRFKIKHMNTGHYLGALGGITYLSNTHKDGGAFTIPTVDNDKFYIVDGNNAKMNEADNSVNATESDYNKWYIDVAERVEVPLTAVGNHTFATAYLPFAVSSIENAKAYIGEINTEKTHVTLSEVSTALAAEEGMILIGNEEGTTTATLHIGGQAEKNNSNVLEGTLTGITFSDAVSRDAYRVMGKKNGAETTIGFFKPSDSMTSLGANRAYIRANSTYATGLTVGFGQVEGIGQATMETTDNANAPIYDLSGRRVNQLTKGGIYIKGGKKVIVK